MISHSLIKYRIAALGFVIALVASVAAMTQLVHAADSCTQTTDYGTATAQAAVTTAGSYTLWTHMKIPSSSAKSVLLSVDGTCYNMGASAAIPVNTWTWVNYYDGNSANVAKQTLNQGNHAVKLIGNAPGVIVDQLEFVIGTCAPTGNGSNCTSTTTTGGGTSGGGGTTGTSSGGSGKSGGTSIPIIKNGGTLTPTTTNTPTQVSAPFTVQPATADPGDPIEKVQYYLNKKLLATLVIPPFSYQVNTRKILNGTYTLTSKTTYQSGKTTTTTQKLIIKNPASLTQVMLAAEHYIVIEIVVLAALIAGIILLRKWLRSRRSPTDGMLPPTTGDSDGGPYVPLSYNASPMYGTEPEPMAPPSPTTTPPPVIPQSPAIPPSGAMPPTPILPADNPTGVTVGTGGPKQYPWR